MQEEQFTDEEMIEAEREYERRLNLIRWIRECLSVAHATDKETL